jgi:hypothetical protein
MNIKQFYVKQKIDSEVKNWRENEWNKEHDKIIQYFPQNIVSVRFVTALLQPKESICIHTCLGSVA